MRNLAGYLSCALLAAALSTACVSDGTKEDCVGFKCPAGFEWPNGGEIRMWYIHLPTGGDITRLFGIFINDEDPATPELADSAGNTRPLPPLGRCAPDPNGVQGLNRVYQDIGPEMTFSLGGGQDITVPRITPDDNGGQQFVDPYGRKHDLIYYLEDFNSRDASFFNTRHSATAQDMLPFAVRSNDTGEYQQTDTLDGLYMPPKIKVLDPPSGSVQFKRGEPLNVEWESTETPLSDVVHATAIVIAPTNPAITPTLCTGGDTGQFTVPAETIDALQDDSGVMVIGFVSNEAVLTDAGRIMNMWGISCQLVTWTRN